MLGSLVIGLRILRVQPWVQVAAIVARATAFALEHLSARGRDCYFVQLLAGYHALQRDPVRIGGNVEYTPEWSCC